MPFWGLKPKEQGPRKTPSVEALHQRVERTTGCMTRSHQAVIDPTDICVESATTRYAPVRHECMLPCWRQASDSGHRTSRCEKRSADVRWPSERARLF